MRMTLQKLTKIFGALSLLGVIPVIVAYFFHFGNTGAGVWIRYCSLPFCFFVSLFLLFAAVYILYSTFGNGYRHGTQKLSSSLVCAAFVLLSVFLLSTGVVSPLRDIPYLNHPSTISLGNARLHFSSTGDSPTVVLEGESDTGKAFFQIGPTTYAQCRSQYERAGLTSDESLVAAQIKYLPNTQTVLEVKLELDASPSYRMAQSNPGR